MGICKKRCFFLTICLLEMVTVVERQVFDFLGFLWIPILVNFFEIVFIIFGFFGAYQYRPKYIIAYLIWHIFWVGWNSFMICLYLNVAGLDHEKNKVLKLDLNSDSWWKKEGPGCRIQNVDAVSVEGCLINYIHIEIIQAGIQCFFALLNIIVGICLSRTFLEEDDTFNYERPNAPDSILLHPKYVTYGDNLHSSNKYINTSNTYLFPSFEKFGKHRQVNSETIREPKRRSNSFQDIHVPRRKVPLVMISRPTSLYSDRFNF